MSERISSADGTTLLIGRPQIGLGQLGQYIARVEGVRSKDHTWHMLPYNPQLSLPQPWDKPTIVSASWGAGPNPYDHHWDRLSSIPRVYQVDYDDAKLEWTLTLKLPPATHRVVKFKRGSDRDTFEQVELEIV